jgi:Mce-associated membrane protein
VAVDAASPEGELSRETPVPGDAPDAEAGADVAETEGDDTEAADTEAADTEAADTEAADTDAESGKAARKLARKAARKSWSAERLGLVVGLVAVVALAGLGGWLGVRAYHSHQELQRRELFLAVGRQGAINLTTISYTEADTDVQRILDSATGTFYDDFSKRSQPFVDVVKQAQSKSVGTVTEAGLESVSATDAQVLVAVTVHTSNAGAAEQEPRSWRMRISVQKVGDQAKVSNVEFVP